MPVKVEGWAAERGGEGSGGGGGDEAIQRVGSNEEEHTRLMREADSLRLSRGETAEV